MPSLRNAGMKKKIVFFFPSFASSEATAPLGILAVATPLIRAGYEICLIDSTITPNYKKRVLEEARDAICLGISLVTGPMIRETVEIARALKEWNPDFPIILGGWHPSLLPTQTLEAPFVDYVVRGQGEDSLLELVQHIESRSAPDFVAGIGFKRDGKLIFTQERPLRPLVEMPPKAYHLADFDAYERLCGRRWAMYTSSLACPFNCAYCTNAGVYGRKWNALPAEQFVQETVDLTRRYDLEMLWVVDDNFLVDLDRARAIADGLVREGANFQWSIQATTNLVARLVAGRPEAVAAQRSAPDLPGSRVGIAEDAGGHEQGLPGLRLDLRECGALPRRRHSPILQHHLRLSGRRATGAPRDGPLHDGHVPPISGSRSSGPTSSRHIRARPSWKERKRSALRCPTSFEGWADFFPRYTKLPWLNGRDHQRLAGHARLPAHRLRSRSNCRRPTQPLHAGGTEMHFATGALAAGTRCARVPGGAVD